MFSGIIDHCGIILELKPSENALTALIQTDFSGLELGESIAVDGICLTVNIVTDNGFYCDISPETLSLTTAKNFKLDRKLNLERALRIGDRIGGHFVTGHVDQVATLIGRDEQKEFVSLKFAGVDSSMMPLLIKKGSITVNGVSLTINAVTTDGFEVMLIPHTLARTNLSALKINDLVNLEFDYLARVVANQLKFTLAL